jgi:phosphoglycolate phosphatase
MSLLPIPDGLIFDLDGTLWDTCASCAVAWNRVIARRGIGFREIVAEDVRGVTGRPHADCIRTVFAGLPEEQIAVLIQDTMEEDNRVVARLGGVLFPGVQEGLPRLAQRYPLFIVSNCQSGYIEAFLRWTALGAFFRDFECWGNTGQPKPVNTARVMERNGLSAPLFIGDTEGDLHAARSCGLRFVHVGYGFGRCAGFDVAVASFPELVHLCLATSARHLSADC